MRNKTTFQLNTTDAGRIILQDMVRPVIERSGRAIAFRAQSMAASQSSDPPGFVVDTRVGTIRRGKRVITTVRADDGGDNHKSYVAHEVLTKAKDAGRVD